MQTVVDQINRHSSARSAQMASPQCPPSCVIAQGERRPVGPTVVSILGPVEGVAVRPLFVPAGGVRTAFPATATNVAEVRTA